MRDLFLLEPGVVYLNHGSFGACPRPVFEGYQRLQLELEREPVRFLSREYEQRIEEAKAPLAHFVGADPASVVFVPNATSGLSLAARSVSLGPGDEVLTTDHEYGAVDLLWGLVCERAGARIVRREVTAGPRLVDDLWAGVTERTRVVSISHVTSPTALVIPVGEICRRAREARILSFVDGAHAPGQVPLALDELGADVYAGNCHKWLCSPKGAGFLYARPEHQAWIEPLVAGWGLREEAFAARHRWAGTRDPAAVLAVPAALEFQAEHRWDEVRPRCHALAEHARVRLAESFALEPLAPDDSWLGQMVSAPLPPCEPKAVQRRLFDEHRIEVPLFDWNGRPLIRVSFQGYNDEGDLDRLLEALPAVLQVFQPFG